MADEARDGNTEHRIEPYEYQMRSIIRDELEPIKKQQHEMRQAQLTIERKVLEWETAAKWFRFFVLGTVAVVAAAVKVYEWAVEHLR